MTDPLPTSKAAGRSYAARTRAASPARHSTGGDGGPNLATAARARVSSAGGRARSSSPAARRSSLGGERPSPIAAGLTLQRPLVAGNIGGGSYAAQARGSSPLRSSWGGDGPVLSARCRSASPAHLRGDKASASPPACSHHQPGSSSSDKHKQQQQSRPRRNSSSGGGGPTAAEGHKKVGEYDRPWRQNMKPASHMTPSPARAPAGTAAANGAASTPRAPVAAAQSPEAATAADGTIAAAAAAVLMLAGGEAAAGQPYVLKSKRRTAEEHAALQVGQPSMCLPATTSWLLALAAPLQFAHHTPLQQPGRSRDRQRKHREHRLLTFWLGLFVCVACCKSGIRWPQFVCHACRLFFCRITCASSSKRLPSERRQRSSWRLQQQPRGRRP